MPRQTDHLELPVGHEGPPMSWATAAGLPLLAQLRLQLMVLKEAPLPVKLQHALWPGALLSKPVWMMAFTSGTQHEQEQLPEEFLMGTCRTADRCQTESGCRQKLTKMSLVETSHQRRSNAHLRLHCRLQLQLWPLGRSCGPCLLRSMGS